MGEEKSISPDMTPLLPHKNPMPVSLNVKRCLLWAAHVAHGRDEQGRGHDHMESNPKGQETKDFSSKRSGVTLIGVRNASLWHQDLNSWH
jgi:hypothetical protein